MKILCSIFILAAVMSSTLAKPGVYEGNSDGKKAYKSALLKYLLRQFNSNNVYRSTMLKVLCSMIILISMLAKHYIRAADPFLALIN